MIKFQKIFLFYQNQDFILIKITKIGFQNHQFTFVLTIIYPKYLKKMANLSPKMTKFQKIFLFYQSQHFIFIKITKIGIQNHQFASVEPKFIQNI